MIETPHLSTAAPVAFGVLNAVASTASRTARGDHGSPSACIAERSSAMPPHAFGEAIEVPFISWRPCSVHVGTGLL